MKTSTFADTIKAWFLKKPALSRAFAMEESPFVATRSKEMHPLLHAFAYFYGQKPFFRLHSTSNELWLCYDDADFGLIRLLIIGKWHGSSYWTNYTALKQPAQEHLMFHEDKTGCVPRYVPDLFMYNIGICRRIFSEAVKFFENKPEKLSLGASFWTSPKASEEFHVTMVENILYSNSSKLRPLRSLPARYKPAEPNDVLSTFSHFLRANISPEVFGMQCTPNEKQFWEKSIKEYCVQYLDNNGEPYPHDTDILITHIPAVLESYWLYALASATLKFNILACSFDAEVHMGYSALGVFTERHSIVATTEWLDNAEAHGNSFVGARIIRGKYALAKSSRRPGKKAKNLLAFDTADQADYMPITQNHFVPLMSYELWTLFGFMDVAPRNACYLDSARFYRLGDRLGLFAFMRDTLQDNFGNKESMAATPLMFLECLMYLQYGRYWEFEQLKKQIEQSNPVLEQWVAQEDSLARRIALTSMAGVRYMSAEQVPKGVTIGTYLDKVSKSWVYEDDYLSEMWSWNRSSLHMGSLILFSKNTYEDLCTCHYEDYAIDDDNNNPYDDDDE